MDLATHTYTRIWFAFEFEERKYNFVFSESGETTWCLLIFLNSGRDEILINNATAAVKSMISSKFVLDIDSKIVRTADFTYEAGG